MHPGSLRGKLPACLTARPDGSTGRCPKSGHELEDSSRAYRERAFAPVSGLVPDIRDQQLRANSGLSNYRNPGVRGRYQVQLPNSFLQINTIGIVRRIPCSIVVLKAASQGPGTRAETCCAAPAAASASAVLNAAPRVDRRVTANGPI